MKTLKNILKSRKSLFSGLFALYLVFGGANIAFAATPSLSLSNTGNNVIQLNVTNADPNASINLYYNYSSSSNVYVANLGSTNSSGYFSTSLNQNSYSIPQNAYVYVIVNGQSSATVLWPSNNSYGNVTLSQNSLTLGYNQSANVNVYGGNNGYYVSSNSNSSVASATLSGSTLNLITYNTTGNSTITVCSYNNNGCATLYVYVQSGGNNQPTYFSQSSVNLSVGQGQAINIYGSGSYSISSNSNPTAISSIVNGSILNVYGSAPGSGTLNVCSTGGGGCASLYVAVGGYVYNNNNNTISGNYNYNTYYNGRVLGSTVDASSVYLNQVPSTGISLNLKVVLFMIGLLTWSLFAAYIFVAKKRRVVR